MQHDMSRVHHGFPQATQLIPAHSDVHSALATRLISTTTAIQIAIANGVDDEEDNENDGDSTEEPMEWVEPETGHDDVDDISRAECYAGSSNEDPAVPYCYRCRTHSMRT